MGQVAYLLDSNTTIDYLDNKLDKQGMLFINKIVDSNELRFSVISKIEVLGFNIKQTEALTLLNNFVDVAFVYYLDEAIVSRTIAIRKTQKIKLPDAIIAATAVANKLTLITRNAKDFEKINKLKVINPYSL